MQGAGPRNDLNTGEGEGYEHMRGAHLACDSSRGHPASPMSEIRPTRPFGFHPLCLSIARPAALLFGRPRLISPVFYANSLVQLVCALAVARFRVSCAFRLDWLCGPPRSRKDRRDGKAVQELPRRGSDLPMLGMVRCICAVTAAALRPALPLPLTRIRRCFLHAHSRSHLALHDELVSKAFQGRHGRAYLFGHV